jgi:nitroimidazol reductase NimA-like FMN-containing flavoprotein (pyridoxamine 5'-phosphate oxidase superfamily)
MRRHDREIASRAEIDAVIRAAEVCRLAFARDNEAYVVPLSFGFDGRALYFHSAPSGRKLDFIAANPRVCFELESEVALRRHDEDPCAWSFNYASVIGYGTVVELTSARDKARGLDEIMRHYSGRGWVIPDSQLAATRVWRVEVESVTGKRSPHPDSVGGPPL